MERSCLAFLILLLAVEITGSSYNDRMLQPAEICKSAKYKDFCLGLVRQYHDRPALIRKVMLNSKHGLDKLFHSCNNFTNSEAKVNAAINDCKTLFEDAYELVNNCLSKDYRDMHSFEDVRTWMSGALTNYDTCIDGLKEIGDQGIAIANLLQKDDQVAKLISTGLCLVTSVYPSSPHRGLLENRMLAANNPVVPNVIVAKDRSGQFSSISAAIAAAPTQSSTRYIIYVKQGTYVENFEVPKSKPNLMIIGDGIRKTIITGKKSVQDPSVTTFTSATVVISGNNFLGQGITIQNTAGAEAHQAVALRVTADQVAFYKCSFEGFQDTLYAHSLRQFYSQCRIYGTVDFIFGNAAAVFLDSELIARVPLDKQENTYTAQGRQDPNQNTGFSFQRCSVDGNADLKKVIQKFGTYLGRPWKEYSRTVFLKCFEGDVIHPAGWLPWDGDFALKTLFYGEYLPSGPGSATSQRVSWSTQITDQTVANTFTVRNFLNGQAWLPQTSFPFQLDL